MNAKNTFTVLRRRRLAYHYFIERDGRIYKYVDPKYIAKHAGISFHEGLFSWNKFSIGVCLQGVTGMVYTDQQYESLKQLITYLNQRYTDLKTKPIKFHSQIAFPWGRKNDPGVTFDTMRIIPDTL